MNEYDYKIKLSPEEIERFCEQFTEYQTLTENNQVHIRFLLNNIIKTYNGEQEPGGFVKAVLENNFSKAVTKADLTTFKCIKLFACFVSMYIPDNE